MPWSVEKVNLSFMPATVRIAAQCIFRQCPPIITCHSPVPEAASSIDYSKSCVSVKLISKFSCGSNLSSLFVKACCCKGQYTLRNFRPYIIKPLYVDARNTVKDMEGKALFHFWNLHKMPFLGPLTYKYAKLYISGTENGNLCRFPHKLDCS